MRDRDAIDRYSLEWLVIVLVRERRALYICSIAGMLAGLWLALGRKPAYTSSFSFLPEASQDGSKAGLASLAGQFGISLGAFRGASASPQLYADMLLTRAILAPIAMDSFVVRAESKERVRLSDFFHIPEESPTLVLEHTVRELRRNVIAANISSKTDLISVTVHTASPLLSFEIANRLLQGLNDFNTSTRQSQARAERLFTEKRYAAARESLRGAEDTLQQFEQANRQFQGSPQLLLQRDRLQRDVSLQQQVVTTLAQQYEDVRIREVRDTPVITVIERAAIAASPEPRLRGVTMILATGAGLLIGVLVALSRDAIRRATGHNLSLAFLWDEWKRVHEASSS